MKWLAKIKEVASIITALTVVVGVLWGAFKFMDRTATTHEALEVIQEQQTVVIDSLASLSRQVQDVKIEMEGVKENMLLMGNAYNGLKNSYVQYVKDNTSATEKFIEYMNPIMDLLKKNSSPIAYQPGSTK